MTKIIYLAEETVVIILGYLRATDMVSCLEVNKTLFTHVRLARAIEKMLIEEYGERQPMFNCRPCVLYCAEINLLLSSINSPSPTKESGYWVSSSWLCNSKLYYEALSLPDTGIGKKSTPNKKLTIIRARRGSDALPPWLEVNSDITCQHEGLASSKGQRAKRRLMDKKNWRILRQFFPGGLEFKAQAQECIECQGLKVLKSPGVEVRGRTIDVSSPLYAVFMRKNGVPLQCLSVKDEFDSAIARFRPLLPGLYHIVPRAWLRSWRQFMKDASIVRPPIFDCASVLCEEHGILLVPPHVEEYLVGLRKSLLGGLAEYTGDVMEILASEEFSTLQRENIKGIEDFSVCFSCDAEGEVQWNIERCSKCDPRFGGHLSHQKLSFF
jgi:hypothetical protein